MKTKKIKCLAYAEEIHWPQWNLFEDELLNGKIKLKPIGTTVWWLDEKLQPHRLYLPRGGSPMLCFKIVERKGITINLNGEIGEYEIKYSSCRDAG